MIASITPNPIAPAWLKRWVPVPKVVESSTLWVKRNMIIAMKAIITANWIKFEKESLDLFRILNIAIAISKIALVKW